MQGEQKKKKKGYLCEAWMLLLAPVSGHPQYQSRMGDEGIGSSPDKK